MIVLAFCICFSTDSSRHKSYRVIDWFFKFIINIMPLEILAILVPFNIVINSTIMVAM
jgi:hypothetical protein